jgi:hypothetical protein
VKKSETDRKRDRKEEVFGRTREREVEVKKEHRKSEKR